MSPVLAFPDFSLPFTLETDASIKGLGAVLSQKGQEDGRVHPVAYASILSDRVRDTRGSQALSCIPLWT